MSFKFVGMSKARKQLKAMPDKALRALGEAVFIEGQKIRTEALSRVPVDLGTLKSSIFVDRPVYKGPIVSVTIGAGGQAAAYAAAVHEYPSAASPPSWVGANVTFSARKGKGPKFISNPVQEAERGFGRRVGRTLERRLI